MSKKHKKVCRVLNYIEHLLILVSTVTGCVSISDFTSLVGIPIEITSLVTAGNKKYKSITKERKRSMIK